MAGSVKSEEVTVLLLDDGVPVPGISLWRDPCFKGEGLMNFRGNLRIAKDAGSEAVKFHPIAAYPGDIGKISLDLVFRLLRGLNCYRTLGGVKGPVGS